MLLSFIPFLYTLVRTNLIADSLVTDGLGIAGHIEWFDLINETVQAFLIVPLYALLNRCIGNSGKLKERIFQSFLIVNAVSIVFFALIFIHCSYIVSIMVPDHVREATEYLKLETVGFIIGNIVSYVNVLFVVLEKTFYIYAMIVLKTIFTIIGDLFLIPQFGVNGVAYSNIVINIICVALCMIFIFREKLFVVSFRFKTSFLEEYLFIGLFSGSQILLDNLIYSVIVCKMVNEVAEQGNYWVANNIIWGLMLIPISALAEIIKKECRSKLTLRKIKNYNSIIIATFLIWLCFIPMISLFLKNVMGIENHEIIKQILVTLIPFYLAYSYTVLLDNILIGYGKTQYCFIISAVVNLIYYPIVYILMLKGVFTSGMKFICMMFGFGMVSHLGCSILCFIIYIRNSNRKRILS
ncbi:sodium transporter [bacterium C-53]|nr:sodium transporter [Lachnospiraceae bacterium]NBI03488.1 sodium transporter [Lachnospiraceae bacterium]RKJ09490.1 sodium transporter [bacterium C-53]